MSVLDALTEGKSRSKIMEWMLVTDEILVAHYGEREYIVTPFCRQEVCLDVTSGVKQYSVIEIPLACFPKTCLAMLER